MKTNEKRFFTWLGLAGLTLLLSAFLLTLFDIINLKYIETIVVSDNIENIFSIILYIINIYLLCTFLNYSHKLKYIIIYSSCYFISSFLYKELAIIIQCLLLPLSIVFVWIIFNIKRSPKIILSKCILFMILGLCTFALSFIRNGEFIFYYDNANLFTKLYGSLDVYIVYAYFMKGGDKNDIWLEFLFLSKNKSVQQISSESQDILGIAELTKKQRAIFYLMTSGYQIFQLLVVLTIGLVNNLFVELLLMLLIFWNGRTILGNCWHSDKLTWCSIATFTGFYILTKITPPLEISLFLIISLCGAFTYFMYVLGNKSDRLDFLENQETKKRNLSEENIKRILIEKKVKLKYHDYLIKTICYGMKDTDWFGLEQNRNLNLDEQQYRNKKYNFKKILKEYGILL